jgi:DNA recombination protein RmuC
MDGFSYNAVSPMEILLLITLLLGAGAIVLLLLLYRKAAGTEPAALEARLGVLGEQIERMERGVREELARNRTEAAAATRESRGEVTGVLDQLRTEQTAAARSAREEIQGSLTAFGDSLAARVTEMATLQKSQLDSFARQMQTLTDSNEQKFERLREAVELRLRSLQEENSRKLEEMRVTVDEKLHATLEQRLGESFRQVSDRLEQVHRGLGEMQNLASGVGDLKRVLTNVKTRGTWGEIQLGAILEQILTPDQYARNVATRAGSADRVEYAVRLPGRESADNGVVWLPIDAKFPQEDYQRLLDAQEQANPLLADEAGRQLEIRIKLEAKSIREKYLDPPHTTDFAILFLPIEGLYAEVLRRPGLADGLQRDARVTIAGPTTLAAILNSLQMGFRTLAIEKRSSEVWALLGGVKTEFGRFGEILEKTQKKLQEASNTIEAATARSRTIERKLRTVQELPAAQPGLVPDAGEEREEP